VGFIRNIYRVKWLTKGDRFTVQPVDGDILLYELLQDVGILEMAQLKRSWLKHGTPQWTFGEWLAHNPLRCKLLATYERLPTVEEIE
jgi:hypothetical protein